MTMHALLSPVPKAVILPRVTLLNSTHTAHKHRQSTHRAHYQTGEMVVRTITVNAATYHSSVGTDVTCIECMRLICKEEKARKEEVIGEEMRRSRCMRRSVDVIGVHVLSNGVGRLSHFGNSCRRRV